MESTAMTAGASEDVEMENQQIVCSLCSNTFKDVSNALAHVVAIHSVQPEMAENCVYFIPCEPDDGVEKEDEPVIIKSCDVLLDMKVAKIIPDCKDRMFSCTKCKRKYQTSINAVNHVSTVHGVHDSEEILEIINIGEVLQVYCSLCRDKFKHVSNAFGHVVAIHSVQPEVAEDCVTIITSESAHVVEKEKDPESSVIKSNDLLDMKAAKIIPDSQKRMFSCTKCDQIYRRSKNAVTHVSDIHGVHDTENILETIAIGEHEWQADKGPSKCPECDYVPRMRVQRGYMYYHMHLKHGIPLPPGMQLPKCQECNTQFLDMARLRTHVDQCHKGVETSMCEMCGLVFKTRNTLKNHIYGCHTHPDVRKVHCEQCGKGFKERGSLRYHMRTHSEDKPFACQYCDYRSRMRHNLTKHMSTKHSAEISLSQEGSTSHSSEMEAGGSGGQCNIDNMNQFPSGLSLGADYLDIQEEEAMTATLSIA